MITFREERISAEYFAFVREYWEASPENANSPPLSFNLDMYANLDRGGSLRLFVGRDDKCEMVAAALYIITPNPKHLPSIAAVCDTYAVARAHRGHGLGTRMMTYVCRMLRSYGVNEMINGYRAVYGNVVPLFEKLGFAPYEVMYRKELVRIGDEAQLNLPLFEGVI